MFLKINVNNAVLHVIYGMFEEKYLEQTTMGLVNCSQNKRTINSIFMIKIDPW